jgi:hypothetical protein
MKETVGWTNWFLRQYNSQDDISLNVGLMSLWRFWKEY